jgi:hypothetical protein
MLERPGNVNDNRDLHGGAEQTVELCNCFDALHVQDGNYELLVRSLPYDLARDNKPLRYVLSKQRSFRWTRRGQERSVSFDQVAIVPQGVGAQEMFNRDNQSLPPVMTIIDVGSYTLDVVTTQLNDGTGQYGYHPASGSKRDDSVSINGFKTRLNTRITNQGVRQAFGYHELMELVEKAASQDDYRVYDAGDYVDFRNDFAQLRRELTANVRRVVRHDILTEAMWPKVQAFVLTGGGAELLDLDAWDSHRPPQKMDIFSNVIGQYHAATARLPVAAVA